MNRPTRHKIQTSRERHHSKVWQEGLDQNLLVSHVYACTSHKKLTHVRLCPCTESDGLALFITGHVEVGQVDVT